MADEGQWPDVVVVRAHLDIMGVEPETVSHLLGVVPDESWRAGDRFLLAGQERKKKFHLWRIGGRSTCPNGVIDLLAGILARLEPVRERFALIPDDATIACEIWLDLVPGLGAPGCVFDARTIQFLAAIGAEIDIDISVAEVAVRTD